MSKIVISMLTAVFAVGCTTVVVQYPPPDADASIVDGSTTADADATSNDDGMAPFDAGHGGATDATTSADATMDANVPPPVCTDADNPDCCLNGQPIRVGLTCGTYPARAEAICTALGVCHPQIAQSCTLVTACCDGWAPRFNAVQTPCHCADPTGEWVAAGYTGCSQDPTRQDDGPGSGVCVYISSMITCALHTP